VLSHSIHNRLGSALRSPLRLIPNGTVLPILSGKLAGKRWIVGSGIHRCWLGFYERDKQNLIAKTVKPNSVFYDVGANVGIYSLLASTLVQQGKVFAFEPLPRNLQFIREHLRLNKIRNVEVLPTAVSDENGTAHFEVEETGYMGHLTSGSGISVQTATLDSLVQEGRIPPPNYIKMDVEGAETMALRGATEIFRQYRPILFLATHGHDVHAECLRFLESVDYDARMLSPMDGDKGEIFARPRG
jgi:FkbM family methyltransferase